MVRIDQGEAGDRQAEELLCLGVRAPVGAEPRAGQDVPADLAVVALAFVDELGPQRSRKPCRVNQSRYAGPSNSPLGVPEPGAENLAVDDGGAIGGEHHVRQARHRIDELHGVAE